VTSVLGKAQQAQILTPEVLRLMKALGQKGEARVVGGAVRDVLLSRPVGDIDLAMTLPPEEAMDILAKEKIRTVPTGLAHGTITAVLDHKGYEITTLRHDVTTDGRHAQVAFTDDWRADSMRRDFTINALYLDASGTLYDYFGGAEDAKDGRVRFIGDARARIAEDILRILRFYRFYAYFGKGAADFEALEACRALASLIPRLSMERVSRECLKLLAADNPLPAWRLMKEGGILNFFAADAIHLASLQSLLENEAQYDVKTSAHTRLASLLPQDVKSSAALAMRFKFSNRDGDQLCVLAKLPALLHGKIEAPSLRHLIYLYGPQSCKAAVLLQKEGIAEALATIAAWEAPVFPIKGEDVLKSGVAQGPDIGKILSEVEAWWIAGDFRADRTACLAQLKRLEKDR